MDISEQPIDPQGAQPSEFPPEQPPDVTSIPETVDNRSLAERLVDKNWKTRLTAYEDLKSGAEKNEVEQAGEAGEAFYGEYAAMLPKITADSNAGALDAGFDAAISFVDKAPIALSLQHADKLFANAVDKALSARPSTQTKGRALLLKLMEVDDCSACCAFLLSKLSDKKPKIPPACIEVMKEALAQFGVKALPVKDILKALPAVFNGTNGPAREAAMALLVELYRWIGSAPLQPLLEGVRSAQKSDFEKIVAERAEEFAAHPVQPSLYLRRDRAAALAAAAKAATDSGGGDAAATGRGAVAAGVGAAGGIDAREFVEEVDLPKKLKGTEYSTLIAQEKWSEQLRGLQLVIDAVGPTPKLKPGCDVYDIVQTCKGFLRQGHLQLQIASLKVLQLFADGLRQEFATTLRPLLQQIILKSKEKRLVPEVQGTLNAAFAHCMNVDPCVDDMVEVIRSKKSPPHSKIGMIEVFCAVLSSCPDKLSGDALKPVTEALVSEAEDSDAKVRDACLQGLLCAGRAAKAKGRLAADALKVIAGLEQSAPKVFKKYQAAVDGAAAGEKAAPAAATAAAATAGSPPRKQQQAAAAKAGGSPSRTSSSAAISKSTTSLPSRAAAAAAGGGTAAAAGAKKATGAAASAGGAAADDDAVDDLVMGAEEAEEALAALEVPGWADGKVQAGMSSAKWQEKVDSLAAIERRLAESKLGGQFSAPLVRYLSATSNAFKISNLSVLKSMLQTCTAIAQHAGDEPFNRPAAWELIRTFCDKLSDRKMKELVGALLSALVECLGGVFVAKRAHAALDKIKAPLAHQHYLEWLKQAIVEFGCGCFPVLVLASFCQSAMENKNAGIRTAAVEVMGALHFQIGPKLQSLAYSDDMKPQTKALIEAEFAKVGHDPVAAAANITRKAPAASSGDGAGGKRAKAGAAKVNGAAAADGGGGVGAAAGGGDPFLLELPRQDLTSMLDKNIVSELSFTEGKTSWQRRKAAMEAVIATCVKSGHNLEMNKATVELVKAFKPRMADTQANLKPIAAAAIGHLVASFDPDASGVKVLRVMGQPLMLGLADNKKPMRDATVQALQNAVTSGSGDDNTVAHSSLLMVLLPAVAESLVNVVGRQELLAWLVKHLTALRGDCSEMVPSLVLCLQDKSSAVRALGEEVLLFLMASGRLITRACFDKATRDLAPANKRAIQPVMDRLFAAYGSAKEAQQQPQQQQSKQQSYDSADDVPLTKSNNTLSAAAGVAAAAGKARQASAAAPEPSAAAPGAILRGGGGSSKAAAMAAAQAAVNSLEEDLLRRSASGDGSQLLGSVDRTPGGTARWDLKRSAAGKTRKMEEFNRFAWPLPPNEPGDDEMRALRAVWEPMMTNDLVYLVFPKTSSAPANQAVYVPGMLQLIPQLQCPYFAQHQELVLKWCSVLLCLKQESTHGLEELLKFICAVFKTVRENAAGGGAAAGVGMLSESELMCILPHLVDRAGHRYERQQALFKAAINAAADVAAPNKVTQILLSYGLRSANKRSRCVALELIEHMVQTSGMVALGTSGVRDVAAYLDGHDVDIVSRSVCLELLFAVYTRLGSDFNKLRCSFGTHVSERSQIVIEEYLLSKAARDLPNAARIAAAHLPGAVGGDSASGDDWDSHAAVASAASASASGREQQEAGSLLLTVSDEDGQVALAAADSPLPAARISGTNVLSIGGDGRGHNGSNGSSDSSNSSGGGLLEMQMHRSMLQEIDNIIASTPKAIRQTLSGDSGDGIERLQQSLSEQRRRENSRDKFFDSSTKDASPATAAAAHEQQQRQQEQRRSGSPCVSPVSAEMDTVYRDIEEKIDALLALPHAVADTDSRHEEAKDYLKMLHSIVNGDWSKESVPEDEAMILQRAETLILRLLKCVARAFDRPALVTKVAPDTSLGVDCSLLAIALSTLFALVKHEGVVARMSRTTMFEIFRECLHRICDVRITHPTATTSTSSVSSSNGSSSRGGLSAAAAASADGDSGDAGRECETTAGQVLHALNIVLLKIGHEGNGGVVLGCLIRVLFCCLPPAELSGYSDYRPLPASSTKPTSRLVVNILGERTKLPDAYDEQALDLPQLLRDIHDFFARYPRSTPDDTAFRTVKTVLNEVVQAKGGERVLQLLQQHTDIPRTDFVYALTCRLGRVDMAEAADPNLHQKIVSVIEAITSSRDKVAAIKELHRIKKANPQLDLNVHLMKISTAFRRYVLNTLARLDASDENTENQPQAAHGNRSNGNGGNAAAAAASAAAAPASVDAAAYEVRKFAPVADPAQAVADSATAPASRTPPPPAPAAAAAAATAAAAGGVGGKGKGSAEEALRILEGLRSRSIQMPLHSAGGDFHHSDSGLVEESVEQSPFARTSAKIRNSLSTLTASLDLPPPTKQSGAASASKAATGSAEAALSLEERIRRLKSQSAAGYNGRA